MCKRNIVETRVAGSVMAGATGQAQALADALVAECCSSASLPEDRARLLLLLVSPSWCCQQHAELPKLIRAKAQEKFGYEIPLVGAEMARLHLSKGSQRTPSTSPPAAVPGYFGEGEVISDGAILIMFCTDHMRVSVKSLPRPYDLPASERKAKLRALADAFADEAANSVSLGTSANRDLFAFFPGYFMDNSGRRSYRDGDLHGEVLEAFGFKHTLFGASAANDVYPTGGHQFANDDALESGLALAFIETDLRIGSSMHHGFEPLDKPRVSVDELGDSETRSYRITKLDGKPARETIDRLREQTGRLIFGLPCGLDFHCFPPVGLPSEMDDSLSLTKRVRKGDRLYLLDATTSQMVNASAKALQEAITYSGAHNGGIEILLAFACAGRFRQYESFGQQWREAIRDVSNNYRGARVVAAVCGGEFGRDSWRRARSNNLNVLVLCVSRQFNSRAVNQEFIWKLHEAVHGALTQTRPKEVMRAALEGGIHAGAKGGMFCIVNWKLGKILGKQSGLALTAEGSAQNWQLALEETERETPSDEGPCGVPVDMRDWAVRVSAFGDRDPRPIVDKQVDLLTLSVRARHAIYVSDGFDKASHTDTELCRRANIKRLIAIPLPGSDAGRPFATLQLGFDDDSDMDRERITCLVAYGQKIAAILERAVEREEREKTSEIAAKLQGLILLPPPTEPVPVETLTEFLQVVQSELEALYVHLRIERQPGSGKYDLIAPASDIALPHAQVRPWVRAGNGSVDVNQIEPKFSHTEKETQALYSRVADLAPDAVPAELARVWRQKVGLMKSAALVPLRVRGDYVGAFVIDSDREFFFDDRKQRLVLFAAQQIESLIRNRRVAYHAQRQREQSERIQRLKGAISPALLQATPDWAGILKPVQEAFLSKAVILFPVVGGSVQRAAWQVGADEQLLGDVYWEVLGWKETNGSGILKYRKKPSEEDDRSPDRYETAFVDAISPDSTLRAVVAIIEKTVNASCPFGFDDRNEEQALKDVAALLAATLAMRDAEREQVLLHAQIVTAQKIGAAGLLGTIIMHEMMTPLANIQGDLDTLRDRLDLGSETRGALLDDVQTQTQRMVEHIKRLAQKPVAGAHREIAKRVVELALQIAQPSFRHPAIAVRVRNSVTAPVMIDLWTIVGALLNILMNAREAIGPKGELEVSTEEDFSRKAVVIRVRNTGPAPAAEKIPLLFEIGASSKGDAHMGLGLPLAKRAFDAANGDLVMRRLADNLTEVEMTLPIAAENSSEVARP